MARKLIVCVMSACLAAAIFAGCSQAPAPDPEGTSSGATLQASASPVETTAGTSVPSKEPAEPAAPQTSSAQPSEIASGYKVEVPYDMETVKNSQKSVDEGHSPWQLDAAFVAQVFVSLQISPEGIEGDYPIPYEAFKVIKSSDAEAVVEVDSGESPISKVYLKRLVRQEEGGIWTVVGYDPVS